MKLGDQPNLFNEAVERLVKVLKETSLEMSELRTSQERLLEAIEKLTPKIEKVIRFEERLARIEQAISNRKGMIDF